MQTDKWEQDELGESGEYPGHPVILACMVMDRYPNLESARTVDPGESSNRALRDNFIPGSGCAVNAALNTLERATTEGLESAYKGSEDYWTGWELQSPKNAERAAHGRAQAEKMKAGFESRLKTWGSDKDPGSAYRV